jgi:hypothetical protein
MKNTSKPVSKTFYIVREQNKRRFLTRPTYSGRVRGVWDLMGNAHLFETREQAQSCASNINHRRPEGSAFFAEVRPVIVFS